MTHPFAMMLAQFEKVSKHAAQLTKELDTTPPGHTMIKKLTEMNDTLGQVEQTVKLMVEMVDVFARFSETQIIGPPSTKISDADYRRLAGLDAPGNVHDWLIGKTGKPTHLPYVDEEFRAKSTVDKEHEAAQRASRQPSVYKVVLPNETDRIAQLNEYIKQIAADQAEEFKDLTPEQREARVFEIMNGSRPKDTKLDELIAKASEQMKAFDTDHGRVVVGADEEEGEMWEEVNAAVEAGEVPTIDLSIEEIPLKAESRELKVDVPDEIAKDWFKFNG